MRSCKTIYYTLFIVIYLIASPIKAQTLTSRIQKALSLLEGSEAMQHAIYSLYVVDNKTGEIVVDKNSKYGLAPASCQKIITCATAFEILGKNYTYTTTIMYDGEIDKEVLKGNVYIIGSGDPSLGSNRYTNTTKNVILSKIKEALVQKGIKIIQGNVIVEDACLGTQAIPNEWVWQDIGNYYGAGVWGFNWCENKFDIQLKCSGKEGDTVYIDTILLPQPAVTLTSELTVGKESSGDNAYVYMPPYSVTGYVRGTIPPHKKTFTIRGSMPYPTNVFLNALKNDLNASGISCTGQWLHTLFSPLQYQLSSSKKILIQLHSPPLDSLAYEFMQKSINLYGEALLKTIGLQQVQKPTTEYCTKWVQNFWKNKLNLASSAMQIVDGCGLSPQNKITTKALVSILQYAQQQPWFDAFYTALPVINNIKMKSGTIYHTKAYSGYIPSKNQNSYTFSFIINNFDSKSSYIMEQMFKVLNVLK